MEKIHAKKYSPDNNHLMCEWDSKGQCLSAYKIVNENSVVTLYLYETKLTRIIKFCSVWSIYAVQFWNWCMLLWAMWPVCLMFFNLSLWVCIIHYDISVGRVGVGAWWMLGPCSSPTYFWLLLLIHVFFSIEFSPPPFTWKKRKNSKNCKLQIYRIWWAAFFFSLSSFSKLSQSHFHSLNV